MAETKGQFFPGLLVGLVVGLLVGAVAGAMLPDLISGGPGTITKADARQAPRRRADHASRRRSRERSPRE